MKNKTSLFLVGLLPFCLYSCCDFDSQRGLTIAIDSLPKQNTITVYGLKDGKSLEKKQLSYAQSSSYNNNSALFYFEPFIDVVNPSSTIVLEYTNRQQNISRDTITLTYKKKAEYQQGCGAYLQITDWKVSKNTSKPPHIIKIN